ncbi:unnamed protein product [Spirodela intermedia]|uniref:Uncharacterized protein n=1 Tax=Spirodela intermedia TaxID=51605 RepID=A0A7I8JP25_SPIIN|nr:unnamed protein product [Spirodela intermedia]CAA6671515.1 unnamed protein product [Spirodela intermedia]
MFMKVGSIITHSQKLQDDVQKLALKVKHHEDNMKVLKNQSNKLDESILDMQANHQMHIKQEKTAAAIVCSIKIHQLSQSLKLPFTKDVLGVVATLGKVNDDNFSRLLAEYLGLETMLAIVCRSCESVKDLEEYDRNDIIDQNAGLHGLGPSIGRIIDGRFLRESPSGFLGFAVNMIHVDPMHLSCITSDGKGLRETLFYSLFSHLQVYRTRSEMQRAIPCISDGGISLDGGIIKRTGFFSLGVREEVAVRFPLSSGLRKLPLNIIETEEELKLMHWKRERCAEDMQREESLLKNAKSFFDRKRQELMEHLRESSQYVAQTTMIVVMVIHCGCFLTLQCIKI